MSLRLRCLLLWWRPRLRARRLARHGRRRRLLGWNFGRSALGRCGQRAGSFITTITIVIAIIFSVFFAIAIDSFLLRTINLLCVIAASVLLVRVGQVLIVLQLLDIGINVLVDVAAATAVLILRVRIDAAADITNVIAVVVADVLWSAITAAAGRRLFVRR